MQPQNQIGYGGLPYQVCGLHVNLLKKSELIPTGKTTSQIVIKQSCYSPFCNIDLNNKLCISPHSLFQNQNPKTNSTFRK